MSPFETLCQHIDALVEPGIPLLVHSSLEAIGGWDAQPHEAIQYLLNRLGENGCLLMPTHTSTNPVEAYIRSDPLYDYRKTQPQTGALPSFFLKYFKPLRSLHPWLSVAALGKDAEYYVSEHHTDSLPLGKKSPYYRLCEKGGMVLLLGVSHPNNAITHVHENLVYPDYPYTIYESEDTAMRYIAHDGSIKTMRTHVPLRPPYPGFNEWGAYLEAHYPQVFKKLISPLGYDVMLIDAAGYLEACIHEYDTHGLCLYHPQFTYYPSRLRQAVMTVKRRLGLPPLQGN